MTDKAPDDAPDGEPDVVPSITDRTGDDRYAGFPDGFFDRSDAAPDAQFYGPPRIVTHIDPEAVAAVGRLYRRLAIDGFGVGAAGHVLDLMSSWVSHFVVPPGRLTVVGMNADELDRNPVATDRLVRDLNVDPTLPFPGATFTAAVCCVSVDYLVRPLEVFAEVARVLRPNAPFVCTFSNRCFPTKAIAGWLAADDLGRARIVAEYFGRTAGFADVQMARCLPPDHHGDPLFAVWGSRLP